MSAHDTHHESGHEGEVHHHIVPIPVYLAIFGALIVGTIITVAVAYVDLGAANIFVALAIAVTKASLVVLYFMHVKYSSRLVQLAAVTGFLWLGIMLSFTFADIWTRDWQPLNGWAKQPVDEYAIEEGAAASHGGGHGEAAESEGH